MGKIMDKIKNKNRTRWQNVSKVHQVVYDQGGHAINVCIGAIIAPQTDEAEAWWREKLKLSPFFAPVGSIPQVGSGSQEQKSQTGLGENGTEKSVGATAPGATEKLSEKTDPQDPRFAKFIPDPRPATTKREMGLRKEIDGEISTSDSENATLVENRPFVKENPMIPATAQEELSTGKYGRTRKHRDDNPSAMPTEKIGHGPLTMPGSGGNSDGN